MTIQIDYETEKKLDIDYTQLANRVAHKILETEQCPYEASVNLVITDNEEIKEVNAQFRNINAPTDVLSFPMIPFPVLLQTIPLLRIRMNTLTWIQTNFCWEML